MGNRPMCWRSSQQTALLGSPSSSGFPIDTVQSGSVGAPIRARICAVLLGRPLPGAHLSDPPGSDELEQRGRALGPFLLRQVLFVLDSACLSAFETCHTASSCSGHFGVGDDGCFGSYAWGGSAAQSPQPTARPSRGSSGYITMV